MRIHVKTFAIYLKLTGAAILGTSAPTAFSATALPFTPPEGITQEDGRGRINGFEFPLAAWRGIKDEQAFIQDLQNSVKGKFTVTRDYSDVGTVVTIANVYSPDCRTCLFPTPSNLSKIIASTYSLTLFHMDGSPSFAIISPSGELVQNLGQKPAQYQGNIFAKLAPSWHISLSSEYIFAKSYVGNLAATADANVVDVRAKMFEALRQSGYAPSDTKDALRQDEANSSKNKNLHDANGPEQSIWIKDSSGSVINVNLAPLTSTKTRIQVNEVITR